MRTVICDWCAGSGVIETESHGMMVCPACEGEIEAARKAVASLAPGTTTRISGRCLMVGYEHSTVYLQLSGVLTSYRAGTLVRDVEAMLGVRS